MKYSAKMYAQLLVELITEKKAHAAESFFALLKKNGELKRAWEIVRRAEKIMVQRAGGRNIIVEASRETAVKSAARNIAKPHDVVEEKITPSLVAGIKITVDGEWQLDYSLKNQLDKIFG